MADKDKKDKAVPEDTPKQPDGVKKASAKKKAVSRKKVAKKKTSKKKASTRKKSAAKSVPVSAKKSTDSAQETKVTEKEVPQAKPATTTPAAGNPSRKFEFIFVVLLAIFLAAAIAILSDKKLQQQALGYVHTTMKFLGISDSIFKPQADAVSQSPEIKASTPAPVKQPAVEAASQGQEKKTSASSDTTPWFTRQVIAPFATYEKKTDEAAPAIAPTQPAVIATQAPPSRPVATATKSAPPSVKQPAVEATSQSHEMKASASSDTTPWFTRQVIAPFAENKIKKDETAVKAAPATKSTPTPVKQPVVETASQSHEIKASAPSDATPWFTRQVIAPFTKNEIKQDETTVETAPAVILQRPGMRAPQQPPSPPVTTAAKPAPPPVKQPAVEVAPAPEVIATQPAMPAPAPVIAPVASPAPEIPPVKAAEPDVNVEPTPERFVAEPARATPSPIEAPPFVPEAVNRYPADRPASRQPGYNPYSRYPYGYPEGYRQDYYDQGYQRRPQPQPQPRWPNY